MAYRVIRVKVNPVTCTLNNNNNNKRLAQKLESGVTYCNET